jgi:hypothetical protein
MRSSKSTPQLLGFIIAFFVFLGRLLQFDDVPFPGLQQRIDTKSGVAIRMANARHPPVADPATPFEREQDAIDDPHHNRKDRQQRNKSHGAPPESAHRPIGSSAYWLIALSVLQSGVAERKVRDLDQADAICTL